MNRSGRSFVDETSRRLHPDEGSDGARGAMTGAPWAAWVDVLDFNGDGAPDFAVQHAGRRPQDTPVIWLNDGEGRFSALTVGDFVGPVSEWVLGTMTKTPQGYSFIATQANPEGLMVTGTMGHPAI